MQTFLIIVGGFLVAFALFALFVYLWIRAKVRGFVESLGEAIEQVPAGMGYPPMRIELDPVEKLDWDDFEAVEALAGPLVESGFVEAGSFQVMTNAFVKMRAFSHPMHRIYSVIYEVSPIGVWLDLVTRHSDGTTLTYATVRSPGMRRPPGKPAVYLPGLGARELLDRFLANRPDQERLPTPPEEFAATLQRAHAEEMDWHAEREGPSEEEIRAIAENDGTEVDDAMIRGVQEGWRSHFSEYWEERLRQSYLASPDVSAAEWEKIRDRLVFIHDRLGTEGLVGHFESAVYEEMEEAGEEEDDDDEPRRLEEFREVARQHPPREAFARLNDMVPPQFRFEKYGQLSEPLEADVWLEPEDPYDD